MTEQEIFESIEQLRGEVDRLGLTYYQWKTIHNTAYQNGSSTIGTHSGFWSATLYSLQNTYILGLSKMYDKRKDAFSLDKVVKDCKTNKGFFDKKHLANRKIVMSSENTGNAWTQAVAEGNVEGKFEPGEIDFDALNDLCEKSRQIVHEKIHCIRHQIVAHSKLSLSVTQAQQLYSAVDTDSIEAVIDTAFTVGQSLWNCWVNGHEFYSSSRSYTTYGSMESEITDLLAKASG